MDRDGESGSRPLAAELLAQRRTSEEKRSEAQVAAMNRGVQELASAGLVDGALRVGDKASDFTLPNAHGLDVSLSSLLASGSLIVAFYRGGWCPYCNLELRALQATLGEIRALGASLVAISPERPDGSLSTAEKHGLDFEVLSDIGNDVARSWGLVHAIPDYLHEIYARLPDTNGDDSYELPLPATYVISADGAVGYAHVDPDYRRRAEPSDVLEALSAIRAERAEVAAPVHSSSGPPG
jgi:peroxiredoxin